MLKGTEKSGFEITVDEARRVLRLRCWGMWSEELANSYREELLDYFARLKGKHPWYVMANVVDFPPQHDSVAKVHGELMATAGAMGVKKACSLVSSSSTQMQMRRLNKESMMPQLKFFTDESAALEWLLSD